MLTNINDIQSVYLFRNNSSMLPVLLIEFLYLSQLNLFQEEQMFSACIAGRRFLILNFLKDPGKKRCAYIYLLLALFHGLTWLSVSLAVSIWGKHFARAPLRILSVLAFMFGGVSFGLSLFAVIAYKELAGLWL